MKDSKKAKSPEPMDPSASEARVGTAAINNSRVCYAAKTLTKELSALFPETPVQYSNYDGRNTALDVEFDLTVLDEPERSDLRNLLDLLDADNRVEEVITDEDSVLVSFFSNARTQDSRDSFGLAEAWQELTDPDDAEPADTEWPDDVDLSTEGSL